MTTPIIAKPTIDMRSDETKTFFAVECVAKDGQHFTDVYGSEDMRNAAAEHNSQRGAKQVVVFNILAYFNEELECAEDFARENPRITD